MQLVFVYYEPQVLAKSFGRRLGSLLPISDVSAHSRNGRESSYERWGFVCWRQKQTRCRYVRFAAT